MSLSFSHESRKSHSFWRPHSILAVALLAISVAIGVDYLAQHGMRGPTSVRSQCAHQLHQIGFALREYHDDFGSYPPLRIAGENGEPLHSWRLLLLPYLEQKQAYSMYHFDQAWNSPQNVAVSALPLPNYRCPGVTPEHPTHTDYVAVAHHDSEFAEVFVVVETTDSGINWCEPKDFDSDTMNFVIDQDPRGMSSTHGGGINALVCSVTKGANVKEDQRMRERVEWIPANTPPAQLRAILRVPMPEQ